MGNCITEFNRHLTTREVNNAAHLNSQDELQLRTMLSVDHIIGANAEITTAIEAHRQALREGGIVQPPAPTETIKTIHCPVNLRKETIKLVSWRQRVQVECRLDLEMPSLVELS